MNQDTQVTKLPHKWLITPKTTKRTLSKTYTRHRTYNVLWHTHTKKHCLGGLTTDIHSDWHDPPPPPQPWYTMYHDTKNLPPCWSTDHKHSDTHTYPPTYTEKTHTQNSIHTYIPPQHTEKKHTHKTAYTHIHTPQHTQKKHTHKKQHTHTYIPPNIHRKNTHTKTAYTHIHTPQHTQKKHTQKTAYTHRAYIPLRTKSTLSNKLDASM